ncbi:hypothetical protein IDVR_21910 [Intrasporangium sp. DVR]
MGFVPASSLIFVVIVAIWAAYLLQHWSRRRENAAAARSVDGFTEAMRVLEKRSVLPSTDLSEPRPRSYSVTPARVVRTTVDVKRAVPAAATRRRSPLVARRTSEAEALPPQPREREVAVAQGARIDRASTDRASADRPRTDHEVDPMSAAPPASRSQRRVRAAVLLTSLLWVPVSVTLAVLGPLNWVPVPFAVLTLVAVVVWLRSEARVEHAERARPVRVGPRRRRLVTPEPLLSSDVTQVIRQPQRYAAEPTDGPHQAVAVRTTAATAATAVATATVTAFTEDSASPAASRGTVAAHASPAAYDVVFDLQASEPAPAATEPPAPGTWSPVPVPTPTYAMKAKAEPRYTADGVPADVFDTPEFADEADELDDRALFARRAVSQ